MAAALLAKLKVKPVPAKQESIVVKIKAMPEEDIELKVKIEDKSKQKLINRDEFLQRMKFVKETVTKIPETPKLPYMPDVTKKEPAIPGQSYEDVEKIDEPSIFLVKPKKIGKLVLVPCLNIGKLTYKRTSPLPEKTSKTSKTAKTPKLKVVGEEELESRTSIVKTKTKEKPGVYEGPTGSIKLGEQDIDTRLPGKKEEILIKAPAYYLNNRKYFVNFIETLFERYKKELEIDDSKITCDSMTGEFSLLTHQKLVRDYINIYTPYRGLLLYHGLGSGKTCSSIAIAEGIKTDKRVIIMTPASLQANYRKELMKCGDSIYKKNQYWEFVLTKGDSNLENKLSSMLGIPVNDIHKRKGAWLVDANQAPNYDNFDTHQKALIDDQINKMIENKYKFLNYNGLRLNRLRELSSDFKENIFDNKVVIIDEAHNLISRIVNKIKSKANNPTKCNLNVKMEERKEDNKDTISTILYNFLMTAKNAKIILLTGTPIINYPNEIGILFNILRGCIKTYTFKLVINAEEKINNERIVEILRKNKKVDIELDYIEYKATSTSLIITQNPYGFHTFDDGVKASIASPEVEQEDFIKLIRSALEPYKIKIAPSGITIDAYKALPDTLEEFNNYFIGDNNTIKNEMMFKRRILGLTSFVMDKEKLMPEYTHTEGEDFHVVKIPMSEFQFGVYEAARIQERNLEKNNAKKKKLGAETGGIYDEAVSTYRIFSRAFCNYVFPKPDIKRPMPNDKEDIADALANKNINEDILDLVSVEEKVQNIDGKYEIDEANELKDQLVSMTDQTYEQRIKEAVRKLEAKSSEYLSPEALKIYSPKFLRILENIKNPANKGLHLIYSQFRTLEGIGIMELVLKENGVGHFDIKKNEQTNQWELNIAEGEARAPMYALYTGKEDTEKKEIIRNIFNSNWAAIPESLQRELNYSSNNWLGEVIKVLMITAAGAEGIDLKNVRYVHITESYWHPVRMEQVIGRAKRICSHKNLPLALQTVEVFLYLMTFSAEQLKSDKAIELRLADVGKTKETKSIPLTSDEALYEIATIKENINKNILNAVKETAIDCTLNTRGKGGEKFECFTFGSEPSKTAYAYTPSITMEETDRVAKQNLAKVTFKAVELTIQGVKYALNKATNDVYDLQSYKDALRKKGVPIKVGHLEKKGSKFEFIELK